MILCRMKKILPKNFRLIFILQVFLYLSILPPYFASLQSTFGVVAEITSSFILLGTRQTTPMCPELGELYRSRVCKVNWTQILWEPLHPQLFGLLPTPHLLSGRPAFVCLPQRIVFIGDGIPAISVIS